MTYGRGPEYKLIDAEDHRARRRARPTIDGQAGALDQPDGLRLLQRRPPHPRRRLRPLHQPDRGRLPEDMFLQVKGEGLNVGCNLTWGPCYDFQRQFFEPTPHKLSEPFTVLKYDVEVSGFGSQALGHVCLLNLRDQTYPGSDGHQDEGLADLDHAGDALGQGAGRRHRLRPLGQRPAASTRQAAAKRLLAELDADRDGKLSQDEAAQGPAARALRDDRRRRRRHARPRRS